MSRKSPATALRDASHIASDLRLTSRDVYSIAVDDKGTEFHLSNDAFKRVFRKVSEERSAITVTNHRESIHCRFGYRAVTFVCVLMGDEVAEFHKSIEHYQGRIVLKSTSARIAFNPGHQLLLTDNR